ncbi:MULTISPECIES: tRNA (adenosine(37)-N6)-threonylcarbamoyltransferase complex dimerization subunit type 1 TsaB [Paenibacillus]|uniref:tRNA (adenosine(37)-N6)-threonylcarbamoyltransferase complex dimerization subunit type 1 TsaB n=1 Tax=Paenibacillus TaxID=44249 RepID=UPI0022B93989|nr:tRNA (adenosine(37)-N6)-threonylcarbamoyltransferase complex dimerization subunit type 1 TsaB [Paenibacillus caseinilyticus]MCZ8524016.1 tRNA (adenosine(37)-N6)-threonylcarbamoyltransferase complex dimerization subunit type 1 TsaB [Paenibacillus caseinilyticus]
MTTWSQSPQYDEQGLMLSVDTSTVSMTAALTRGSSLLGEITVSAERNHSLYVVPALQRLLEHNGVKPAELSAFAAGVGPGSYTGTRIGVTVAKTFAWTHSLALLGVSTLEAMALGGLEEALSLRSPVAAPAEGESVELRIDQDGDLGALERILGTKTPESLPKRWVVPMIDARRGQAFTGLYEASASGWTCLVPDGIRLTSLWVEELRSLADSGEPQHIVFTGDAHLHGEAISQLEAGWNGTITKTGFGFQARHVAELGRSRWQRGETEDVYGLVPNYTQLAEAEANLLAAKRT